MLVSYQLDIDLKNEINERKRLGDIWWTKRFHSNEMGAINLKSETELCCCRPLLISTKPCEVYTAQQFYYGDRFTISTGICKECETVYIFDGRDIGMVNFNNRTLIDSGTLD